MTNRLSLSSRARLRRTLPALLVIPLTLAACSSNDNSSDDDITDDDTTDENTRSYAFVSGATPITFDAGQIERLTLGDNIVSSGTTEATRSDIRVTTDGTDVYQIGRYLIDSLTRFTVDDLRTPVWQYSVNGDETAANPYSVAFLSETKAYVARYGSPKVWIINPGATSEAEFKTGEIDLAAYDPDGVPNASDVVIVDDKLFVLMERLDGYSPVNNGYVAVIDTETDTEIDTDPATEGLLGIALTTSNPAGLQYLASSGEIYVTGRGNIYSNTSVTDDPYNGGIETIDPDNYQLDMLIDDGTADDNQGFFADSLVVSPTKGYLLTQADVGETTLRSFNPMTGLLADGAVASLEARDISVLALDPDGRVWIGLNDNVMPSFQLLDSSDDSVLVESVPVEFNPNEIVFVDAPIEPAEPAAAH